MVLPCARRSHWCRGALRARIASKLRHLSVGAKRSPLVLRQSAGPGAQERDRGLPRYSPLQPSLLCLVFSAALLFYFFCVRVSPFRGSVYISDRALRRSYARGLPFIAASRPGSCMLLPCTLFMSHPVCRSRILVRAPVPFVGSARIFPLAIRWGLHFSVCFPIIRMCVQGGAMRGL